MSPAVRECTTVAGWSAGTLTRSAPLSYGSPMSPDRDTRLHRMKRLATRGLPLVLAAVAAAAVWQQATSPSSAPVVPATAPSVTPAPVALAAVPAVAPGLATIEVIVRSNDTLDRIFRKFELSLADLADMRAVASTRQFLDRLVPGELLRLTHREGSLMGFERDLSLTERLKVLRDENGFRADVIARPVTIDRVVAHGAISTSLFEAANDAGLQDATVLKLARLFGWDIDFVLDLRAGDEFAVSYERISQDGKFVQDGEILAARFVNQGHEFNAVRYTKADGSSAYYSPDGRSMEKAFLRAPLDFRRVSSRFTTARYHPILNRIRAHKGVDYAAAIGTPVHAAGAGRIRFRGQKGGYGNVVEIDHGGGIVTVYGHLSRFAANAKTGSRVAQGQLIAYVGMTGLATGPHLHYEYRVNGNYLDPQRVKLPDATPIDAALLPDFRHQTAPLLAALQPTSSGALAAR
jgi:murein DD-endopeptidase MepM/ murein hydrolase activator NlpD